ncbi:MAG: VanZ family protein [Vitreoscilla sp.]|nr:VanZ family protein [Polaromonas sp.]
MKSLNSLSDTGIKTASLPLALAVVCLIIYASLYPFTDWRNQGISPLAFLTAPLPKYWTGFDLAANVLGYAPLGFLLTLAWLRSGHMKWAMLLAVLGAFLLSLALETLQSYLPSRIPSNVDLALNTLGAALGAYTAWALEKLGALGRWSRFRSRWLTPDARGALALLVLWPVALLFPAAVPMGLGQVFERLETAMADSLEGTPFLVWLPVREIELQPLVPLAELVCVALGVLIPLLIGYGVVRTLWRRAVFAVLLLGAGIAVSGLSAALSYGPQHAWAWLDLPVRAGLMLAAALAVVLLPLGRRGAAALALLALAIQLSLLNQAPASAYFAQTLQTWEQGRFIRFHGLAQWLGWLWPYAALIYLVARLSEREEATRT